jgi:hypothetical protein
MYQALVEECYLSLRINIWCYPTSRVFSISCVQYFSEWFGVYCGFILIFIFVSIQVLNKWYQRTFLGQRREEFSLFADFF